MHSPFTIFNNIGDGSERQTQKKWFLFYIALAFHYIYII